MHSKGSFFWLFLWVFIMQTVFYFGFDSAYFSYKNLNELPNFYHENIYQYRVLSTYLLEQFHEFLNPLLTSLREIPYINNSLATSGSNFYISLFLFNLIFLFLMIIILLKTLNLSNFKSYTTIEKTVSLLGIVGLVGFSQYVKTPYDLSSYFFLILSLYYAIKYFNTLKINYFIAYCFIVFISTFNRETSALSLSLFFALGLKYHQWNFKKLIQNPLTFSLPILFFLMAYIGLRLYFGNVEVVQNNYFLKNILNIKNLLGALFFILTTGLILKTSNFQKLALCFLIFTVPYLIMILIGGILWEIRLYVPVLIPLFLLAFLKTKIENA